MKYTRKDGVWEREKCPRRSREHKEDRKMAEGLKMVEDRKIAGDRKMAGGLREIEEQKETKESWRKLTTIRRNPWQGTGGVPEIRKNHREM